jgi:hypothetical protein
MNRTQNQIPQRGRPGIVTQDGSLQSMSLEYKYHGQFFRYTSEPPSLPEPTPGEENGETAHEASA